MLHAGLDLSRRRLGFHLLDERGETVEVGPAPPDADGLRGLAVRVGGRGESVRAAIESMNGARFVHDQLERAGWEVEIADAVKVKGLAPLACKTDRIDAWVLAELSRRELVPAIWLPGPAVRAERERARFRLHLVRHRSALKQRVHAVLLAHGKPCPVSDLFGARGRQLLLRLGLPEPWAGTVEASLRLIDELEQEIDGCERELRQLGADHADVPLLLTVPGIGSVRRRCGLSTPCLGGLASIIPQTTARASTCRRAWVASKRWPGGIVIRQAAISCERARKGGSRQSHGAPWRAASRACRSSPVQRRVGRGTRPRPPSAFSVLATPFCRRSRSSARSSASAASRSEEMPPRCSRLEAGPQVRYRYAQTGLPSMAREDLTLLHSRSLLSRCDVGVIVMAS